MYTTKNNSILWDNLITPICYYSKIIISIKVLNMYLIFT